MKTQLLILALFCATTLTAQVSVTIDGSSPDPSAMLDVKSANKGMLIPRVALTAINSASPITSPAVGLIVYNTANAGTFPNNVVPGFYYWNGTRWVSVSLPQGTTTGDMLYWNGTQWVTVPVGEPMQILKLCNGVPTWGPCTPGLTTTAVFGVTQSAATSGGNITDDGGDAVTARGVCWNTAGNPTLADAITEDGSGTGAFASEVTGLSSGVNYYLRAYATNSAGTGYGNEISFNLGGIDGQACPGTPTFTYGGQTYNTVKIGTQCWMKENLNIGTMISGSQAQDDNQVMEKYCYGNSAQSCVVWGGLYQWSEMMNYSTQQGSRGICPSGWHVPSDGEFCTMSTYLDPTVNCQTMDWTGTNAGGKIKETGTAHWNSPNGGATNSSGYTGFGGGYSSNGSFGLITLVGHWWTSSTDGTNHALWQARCNDALVGRYKHQPELGFSVRCVKDLLPVVTTSAVTAITTETASCGGEVIPNGGAPVTERGVCFNTSGGPTLDDPYATAETNENTWTVQLNGLEAISTYFVRAYITTSEGAFYGNQVVFTTLQIVVPPTAWELAGNSGTDPSVNFIGTTDDASLIFKANNTQSGLIDLTRENTSFGSRALLNNISGAQNTAVGAWALFLTNGTYNTAVGWGSMANTGSSIYNTAVGNQSLFNTLNGPYNTAFGAGTLFSNSIGSGNVALGYNAGYYEDGDNKLYIDNQERADQQAGREGSLIYGVFDADPANQKLALNANVGIGTIDPLNRLHIVADADPIRLEGLQESADNNFLVVDADGVVSKRIGGGGWSLTGNAGTNPATDFIGTLDSVPFTFRVNDKLSGIIDPGLSNTSLGYKTLDSNITGANNSAFGNYALRNNESGIGNTGIGSLALLSNIGGYYNVAIGNQALNSNTEGDMNVAIGFKASVNNTTGYYNTSIGTYALFKNKANIGNTAIGYNAMYNANDQTDGLPTYNTAIGSNALKGSANPEVNWGKYNSALGSSSLFGNSTGEFNTAAGYSALRSNSKGNKNTAIGSSALYNNSYGTGNVALGNEAGYYETGSNKLYIGNSNMWDPLVYGVFDADPANQILAFNANVGIGTTNPSNQLHIVSTANPLRLEGLQTTSNSDVLVVDANGVVTKRAGSFGSGWLLTGNSGTNSSTNFIGTTDSVSFIMKVNNKRSGLIDINNKNTGLGYKSLYSLTSGNNNAAIGSFALYSNTDGNQNTAMGDQSLFYNTTGDYNVAIGGNALVNNKANNRSTAIGYFAMYNADNRSSGHETYNTAVGYQALYGSGTPANNTGLYNTAVGDQALFSNSSGAFNSGYGFKTLYSNTTGNFNTAIGSNSLLDNTSGLYNTAIGMGSLENNTYGNSNTSCGQQSLFFNTTGNNNTALGAAALINNVANSRSTAIGYFAMYNADNRTSGTETFNTAVGYQALMGSDNPANNSGRYNTAIGDHALYSYTFGDANTACGNSALASNTSGEENAAFGSFALINATSSFNTACGYDAMLNTTTGFENTAVGYYALATNTIGEYNTALGVDANVAANNQVNSTVIGYYGIVAASNQAVIGNSSVNSIGGWANWTNWSDKRFKKDLASNVPGLSFIMKLNPVTYHMDVDAVAAFLHTPDSLRLRESEAIKAGILYTGFIAQDVEQAANEIGYDFSGVDKPQNEHCYYGLRYAEFTVPLVKAVQEQQTMIENLQTKIESLQKQINELRQVIESGKKE